MSFWDVHFAKTRASLSAAVAARVRKLRPKWYVIGHSPSRSLLIYFFYL